MIKIFFSNTYKNAKTNASNCSYWSKLFHQIDEIKNYKNEWVRCYKTTNPLFPIYMYLSKPISKIVRIQQIDPEEIEEENIDERQYITAWLDEQIIENENYRELVIVLLLTPGNAKVAQDLINCWFKQDDDILLRKIENIYRHHDQQ